MESVVDVYDLAASLQTQWGETTQPTSRLLRIRSSRVPAGIADDGRAAIAKAEALFSTSTLPVPASIAPPGAGSESRVRAEPQMNAEGGPKRSPLVLGGKYHRSIRFVRVPKTDRIGNGDVPRPHPAPQQTLRRDRVRQGGIKAYPEGCILGATSAGRTVFRSHGSQPARPRADEDLAQMTNHFVRVRTEQIWPNWRKVGRGLDATREKGVRFRADIFGSHSWKDRDPH